MYLFKHRKVPKFIKEGLCKYQALTISHQPPWLGRMDHIVRTKRLTDYLIALKLLGFIEITLISIV